MTKELPKTYNPKEVEDKIYKLWEESGFFNPDNLPLQQVQGKPVPRTKKFVAAIAPPNITGELHIGHALEHTLQDIIIRMKRMRGYKTLWLPGTDHAGIAAQNKVEKQLAKEGTSRHKLGREKFLERMWGWREKYGNIILDQFKKLGLSVDWTRTQFTMNPDYQKAVETAFKKYQEKGWIYQGERVINWCPRCATSISDLEVNYVPEKGKLYFIKYGSFTLATTRPETKLGDTALAVHPSDERYKKYIGQKLETDSVNNEIPATEPPQIKKITLKVVGDISVDKEFGTGIIKVTPAHDLTDYEISQRHKLPLVKIIDERGKMNENAGIRYQGLKVAQAREQIVKDLQALGLIEKVEDYDHNVGHCERCDSVIEPLPSKQWFLKMDGLAKLAIEALDNGEVAVHSEKWGQDMRNWLTNIKDWNISRQLWWGHKIPIDGEEDVLDTWFSSALWPFAVMGWPEKTKDLAEYYPTNFITSDRGIRYLWQARMIFSGKFFTGSVPFKDIYIHATVLTKDGKRMSKSLGTGINPLTVIEKYGADALRFGLAYQTTELQDMKFGEDTIIMGKKFANKFWNIARYVLMKLGDDYEITEEKPSKQEVTSKMDSVAKSVTKNIEDYKFGEAAHELYDFIWHDFADKYIEETKDKNNPETKDTLAYLLLNCLKLLHPFMPFITEEIYSISPIKNKELLMVEKWPV
ncbi:MAG: valine--tRNA ligase [Patescibacteria group bacterium]